MILLKLFQREKKSLMMKINDTLDKLHDLVVDTVFNVVDFWQRQFEYITELIHGDNEDGKQS